MMQVAMALEVTRSLAVGVEVRRWALENLEPDHTTSMHRAMTAFSVAALAGGEEFDGLVSEIDRGDLNPYFEFCLEMAFVVRHLSVGGGGKKEAAAAYSRAMGAHGNWDDRIVLARVQRKAYWPRALRALGHLRKPAVEMGRRENSRWRGDKR
jgi:hypothetical protein